MAFATQNEHLPSQVLIYTTGWREAIKVNHFPPRTRVHLLAFEPTPRPGDLTIETSIRCFKLHFTFYTLYCKQILPMKTIHLLCNATSALSLLVPRFLEPILLVLSTCGLYPVGTRRVGGKIEPLQHVQMKR